MKAVPLGKEILFPVEYNFSRREGACPTPEHLRGVDTGIRALHNLCAPRWLHQNQRALFEFEFEQNLTSTQIRKTELQNIQSKLDSLSV